VLHDPKSGHNPSFLNSKTPNIKMQSNLAVLTQSHAAIAAKRKAKHNQIKEVVFDDDARREFLTGFHKRKVARADAARKKAFERQKQEHLEYRREQRRALRERALENAAQVEKAYGAISGDNDSDEEEEWQGISDFPDKGKGKKKEEEFEDEEILATVTVVEDFDPDFIHGPTPIPSVSAHATVIASKSHTQGERVKKKMKEKIRYQTKDARKAERTKQHARRTEKAQLAGGKASRRKGSKGTKKKGDARR